MIIFDMLYSVLLTVPSEHVLHCNNMLKFAQNWVLHASGIAGITGIIANVQ